MPDSFWKACLCGLKDILMGDKPILVAEDTDRLLWVVMQYLHMEEPGGLGVHKHLGMQDLSICARGLCRICSLKGRGRIRCIQALVSVGITDAFVRSCIKCGSIY